MLSFMDDAGINAAITSISTPGVHMGDDAAARDLARRVNELSAELIQERPDRFGGFAALPLPDVDGALQALEYGLDILKLDGVILFSNARGIYLGDARFDPCSTNWKGAELSSSCTQTHLRILPPEAWDYRIP
jgi:predicted TIM-barrel fold metal-dependent hydrolase